VGYYEVRARIADSSSTSSFWFQGSESVIDVMEFVGNSILDPDYGTIMPINLHYFPGGWANDQAFPAVVRHLDSPGRWISRLRCGLAERVDPVLLRRAAGRHSGQPPLHEPEYHFLDTEAFVWQEFPPPQTLPSRYQIDYVRAWRHG
jgi:hypothetical protein